MDGKECVSKKRSKDKHKKYKKQNTRMNLLKKPT